MILLLIGRIFQILLAVLQIRIATTLLKPDQYGIWILLQTTVGFFVLFLLSPIGLYLNRHVNEWDRKNFIPEVFRVYTIFLFFVSTLSICFFILVQKLHVIDLHIPSVYDAAFIMALLMFSQTFLQTWTSTLNFIGRRKEYVLATLVATTMALGIVLVCAKAGWSEPQSWAVAFSLSSVIACMIFIPKSWYRFNSGRFKELLDSISLRQIFNYSSPLLLSTLFIWFQTQGYRLIVEHKIGLETFGQFAAGYAVVAGLFAALEAVIVSFYQPNFFKHIAEGNEVGEELKQVWNISLYPYLLAVAYIFILGGDVAKLFLHADFIFTTEWISWVALSEGFRVIFNVICVNYYANKKTLSIAWPHFIGVLLTIFLFIFTKKLNYLSLITYVASGYFLSILLLLLIDYKIFHASGFFKKLFSSAVITGLFSIVAILISKQLFGISRVAAVSLLGLFFIAPYYQKHIKGIP